MARKLLFVDVDGVLNSEGFFMWCLRRGTPAGVTEFCPIASSILLDVLKRVPDLKIIVSSCWRVGATLADLKKIFAENGFDPDRILGRTGAEVDTNNGGRGAEIGAWFEHNWESGDRCVILDDEMICGSWYYYWVEIDVRNGLTCADADKIVQRFNFFGEVPKPYIPSNALEVPCSAA